MPSATRLQSRPGRPTRKGKVRKEFWLDPRALRRAQTLLGTDTERQTVELALDLVAFRHEVLEGTRALRGIRFDSAD